MSGWIRLNFLDPQWAGFTQCMEAPIKIYAPELTVGLRPRPACTLSVSNGSMYVQSNFGMFFTPFHCNSSVPLAGPAKLTFALAGTRKFSQLHVKITGTIRSTSEFIRIAVGGRRAFTLPEAPGDPGRIRFAKDYRIKPGQSVFTIESTATKANLVELWWTYEGTGLLPFP